MHLRSRSHRWSRLLVALGTLLLGSSALTVPAYAVAPAQPYAAGPVPAYASTPVAARAGQVAAPGHAALPAETALSPIALKYQELGGAASPLRNPTGPEVCGIRDGGCYRNYQGGAILWSPATGAQPNWGAIRATYSWTGFENGILGYPTGPEICGIRGGGCYQNYQGGAILWSPATGAQPNWGAIRGTYAALGFENGVLGYPTGAESCTASGGTTCRQQFQGGAIAWNSALGIQIGIGSSSDLSKVVNKKSPLYPLGYVPPSLVAVGGQLLRAEAANRLAAMIADAQAAGVPITTVSGYRSYQTQVALYNDYVARYGQAYADTISARPGFSEHQTGLAMDIGNPNGACALLDCFAGTPAGAWAAANAYRYGFIIRYPNGLSGITGYTFEPWHLRYVGAGIATDMRLRGIPTLEQYFNVPAAPTY